MTLRDTYAVLKIRDYRLSLGSRLFSSLAMLMQSVVVGWQVYQLTKDPLALGLIGLAEALPYMGFALWAGHVTDRQEKRSLIVLSEIGMGLCALALMGLARLDTPPLAVIYLLIGVGGLCRSFHWSSFTAYVQTVVPSEVFQKAAAWNSTLWQVAAIAGPALGGWLYSLVGPVSAYEGASALFFLSAGFAWFMRPLPPTPGKEIPAGKAGLLSGVRYVFSQPAVAGAMILDMVAVFFGGAEALFPIFAERLGVGASGLGMLRAAPGIGALCTSLYLAHRPAFRYPGQVMLWVISAFGGCMIAFALSTRFAWSLAFLAAGGMVDNVSVIIRSSIYQALTPDHLRGRVSSVNGIFIRSSNELGAFESGVAAKLLGTVPSVIFGGLMTWASVAVAAWKAPALRRLRLGSSAL